MKEEIGQTKTTAGTGPVVYMRDSKRKAKRYIIRTTKGRNTANTRAMIPVAIA